ncbi:MAG: hypothetical protein GX555_13345 [Actinomycetales bacterium]|nr:hypothetical protein [Actinomycetales bacterium]
MSILSPALLGAVGLVLLAAATGHVRAPASLRRGLDAHGVLPGAARPLVAGVLAPLEAVLGVVALVCAVAPVPSPVGFAVSMPIAGLFLALTLYLARVLRDAQGRVVPCACGLGETPVTRSAVLRPGILAVLALVGGVTSGGWSLAEAPAAEAGVALAAMLVLALSVALLPAARAVPESVVTHSGAHGRDGSGADERNRYEKTWQANETSTFFGGDR